MSVITPVGIDLGTTFSATAKVNQQGKTELIANSHGELLTPSTILFTDESVKVGRSAYEAAESAPDRFVEYVKRDMGQSHYRKAIGGHQYPPEVLQSCILRELRNDIVSSVGDSFQSVITVPAYFDELRRKMTADAGAMSGLEVLDIVNEPTAAALAFGEQLGYLDPQGSANECLTLLVFDLGGGTFDVTVIQLAPGSIRTLATDGDVELGGFNWDERLANHAEQHYRKRYPDAGEFTPAERTRLQRAAELAKVELSDRPLATLRFSAQGNDFSLPVTIDEFNSLTEDLVERTCFTTRQAVQASGLLWKNIDRLLLVGGSSRMPAVRRALYKMSGIVPDDQVHPEEAVVRGAAIFAHHLLSQSGKIPGAVKLAITDVNAHGLGIEGVNQRTLRRENVILIPRNTPLPREVHRSFVTKVDNQRTVKIQLLEGESCLPEQCTELAFAGIRNLPPGLPAGTAIDVWYSFQANGRLAVRAAIPNVGNQARIEVDRVRGLAEDKVVRWKKVLARDGGYSDFEEALVHFIGEIDEAPAHKTPPKEPTSTPRRQTEPAVPFGAPQAAAGVLNSTFGKESYGPDTVIDESSQTNGEPLISHRPRRRIRGLPIQIKILGHLLASVIGLAVGYYVLCWISPESNFLNLELPGISR